jgi:hypothetical protein
VAALQESGPHDNLGYWQAARANGATLGASAAE